MAEQTGKFSSQISPNWLAQIIRPFLRHTSETWLDGAAAECANLILFELDNQPEPDWADLREMARNAGMEPELFVPGEVHWGRRVLRGILEPEHGWVVVRSRGGRRVFDLTGPDRRPARTCSLVDPTPAEILTAARLVGLGGAS